MATSAGFAITTSAAARAENSTSKPNSIFPGILAVPAAVAVLIIAGSAWFCWFRKRRRQSRSHVRSPSLKMKHRSLAPFDSRSLANSTSPLREGKPDVEERSADESLEQPQSLPDQSELVRKSPLPPPPPIPPSAAQASVELPLFITPRSSRQKFNSLRRLKSRTELDINPPSPRPHSVDERKLWKDKIQSPPPARQSKRFSLQPISHLRKLGELEGDTTKPIRSSGHLIGADDPIAIQDIVPDRSRSARRSKRESLQHFLHLRRIAELEGSSAFPNPAQSSNPAVIDEESQAPPARRSSRVSLHRLLHSKPIAELEANVDVLPQYSRTERYGKSLSWAPPLPPKDMDEKNALALPPAARRANTPVELDASEPEQLRSPALARLSPNKSPNQSIAGRVGSSSSLLVAKNEGALEHSNEILRYRMRKKPTRPLAESPVGMPIPETPEAVEFLDLASTESEGDQSDGDQSEGLDIASSGAITSSSNFGTPVVSPTVEAVRTNGFLISEISSSAANPGKSQGAAQTEQIGEIGEEEVSELPAVHEMDSTELVVERSKRHSPHPPTLRTEAPRRRPDFATFKKQMGEAERKAKMIAKRRRSRRRTFKSF
jgi:hypothetical protein